MTTVVISNEFLALPAALLLSGPPPEPPLAVHCQKSVFSHLGLASTSTAQSRSPGTAMHGIMAFQFVKSPRVTTVPQSRVSRCHHSHLDV
jgi:hypothetical protein